MRDLYYACNVFFDRTRKERYSLEEEKNINETKIIDALHTGIINTTADEYIVVDANKGDTLEWQWLNTPEEVTVQIYFQKKLLLYHHHFRLPSYTLMQK